MSTPSRSASSVALPSARTLKPRIDGVVRDGEVDVVLGDRTDAAVDDPQLDLVADVDLHAARPRGPRRYRSSSPLMIRLRVLVSLPAQAVQVLEGDALAPARPARRCARGRAAGLGDLPGDPVLVDDEEGVAGAGHRGEAEHLHRTRRVGLVDRRRRARRASRGPGRRRRPRRSSRRRAACRAAPARWPPGRGRGRGAPRSRRPGRPCSGWPAGPATASAVSRIASSSASMFVPCFAETSTNIVSPPYSSAHQAVLGELLADLGRVGALLVDLVHRDHDRHVGRLGVVERLDRLRHHAVVGRDHEHRDVGRLGAAGTHGGERLVTRGVDEGDRPLVALELGDHLVGADVLGDAAGLARRRTLVLRIASSSVVLPWST